MIVIKLSSKSFSIENIVYNYMKQLEEIQLLSRSILLIYDYLRLFYMSSIYHAAEQLGGLFSYVSNF